MTPRLAIVLATVAVLSLLPLTPGPAWIRVLVLAALSVGALRVGHGPTLFLALTATFLAALTGVPALTPTWPLPLLASLALASLLARVWRPLQGTTDWWRRGSLTRKDLPWAVAFVGIPALSLVAWTRVVEPDLSDLVSRVPQVSLPLLVGAGLVFAMANALAEEAFWRGVMVRALDEVLPRSLATWAIQALSFGLLHFQGFPRGWTGVALATVYGAMMGELRRRSAGLLLPWLVHVFADLVIFAVLATLAGA